MRDTTVVSVLAIGVIGILEAIALFQGINGFALTAAIGALAGLGGWIVGVKRGG